MAKLPRQGAKLIDTPAAIVRQMAPHSKVTNKIAALALLKNRETLNGAVQRQPEDITSIAQQQYLFLEYARKWWILHTKRLEPKSKQLWKMWCRLLTDWDSKADKPWLSQDWSDRGPSDFITDWATQNNHTALWTYIVMSEKPADHLNPRTFLGSKHYLIELVRSRQWELLYEVVLFLPDPELTLMVLGPSYLSQLRGLID